MASDTPRRIASNSLYEFFELSLEVSGYDSSVSQTVAQIAPTSSKVTLTRTNNGYTMGDDNGIGHKPYVETERFVLSELEMLMLFDAWQTVREEQAALQDTDDIPF